VIGLDDLTEYCELVQTKDRCAHLHTLTEVVNRHRIVRGASLSWSRVSRRSVTEHRSAMAAVLTCGCDVVVEFRNAGGSVPRSSPPLLLKLRFRLPDRHMMLSGLKEKKTKRRKSNSKAEKNCGCGE
jgi:hypothetical protein